MSEAVDLSLPNRRERPNPARGQVVRAPATVNDPMYVSLLGYSTEQPYEVPPSNWSMNGGSLPKVGDFAVVLFDHYSDAWVPTWEASALERTGVAIPVGSHQQQLLVRSDGTVAWVDMPRTDVRGWFVKGDGSDETTKIQEAINGTSEGSILTFPRPTSFYGISKPLYSKPRTSIEGTSVPLWWETGDELPRATSARMTNPCAIKALAGFTGEALFIANDSSMEDAGAKAGEGRSGGCIRNIGFGGNRVGSEVHGVLLHGQATDWVFEHVEVADCSAHGFFFESYNRSGTFYQPQNLRVSNCFSHNNGGNGFHLNSVEDSTFMQCWSHENAFEGWFVAGTRLTEFLVCKAEWNGDAGFVIQGDSAVRMISPRTDSNEFWGIKIANEGSKRAIVLVGPVSSRDGRNGGTQAEGAKGGGNFAGIGIIGKAGNPVGPVYITGLAQAVGKDDSGAGAEHPANGIYVEHASYVYIDGIPWGVSEAVSTGTEATIRYSAGTRLNSGPQTTPTVEDPVLNWPQTIEIGGQTFLFNYGEIGQYGTTGGAGVHTQQKQTGAVGAQEGRGRTFFKDDGAGLVQWALQLPTGGNVPLLTEHAYEPAEAPAEGAQASRGIGVARKRAFAYTGTGFVNKVTLVHNLGTYNVNVVAQAVSGGHPGLSMAISFFNAISSNEVEVGFTEALPKGTTVHLTVFG